MILADAFDAFLLDLDGVVWRGEQPVPGAAETVASLRGRGRRVVFVTNNSSRTPRDYAVKLARMQIPTPPEDVVTSAHVVVDELRRLGCKPGDRVHVLGGEGLVRLLTHERFVPVRDDGPVKAVVVGWNPKATFEDIRRAADLLRRGVPGIASNADPTYPAEEGVLPGTGAILAALEVASGRSCQVVGKPRPELFLLAAARAGVAPARALFVGDRPATDVRGARAAGMPSALVLTGVTAERDLGRLAEVPDHILDALGDLVADLPAPRILHEGGELVALEEDELARLRVLRDGGRAVLSGLRCQLRGQAAWPAVRRLLVEAVAGAERVEAEPELRPYLERIGIEPYAQARLFTTA